PPAVRPAARPASPGPHPYPRGTGLPGARPAAPGGHPRPAPAPRRCASRGPLSGRPRPGRGTRHASTPGALPPRPRHTVCPGRKARAGPHSTVHRHCAVPGYGYDVLAAAGGGGTGAAGSAMTRGEGHAAVLHKAQYGHQDTWRDMIPSGRSDAMKATVLLATLVLGICVASLAAAAPPPNTVHRIGFLWNASPSLTHHLLEAFRHGLHERGYVEGKHFTIESRYAEGNLERLPGLAAELVGLQVAVIVTSGSQ